MNLTITLSIIGLLLWISCASCSFLLLAIGLSHAVTCFRISDTCPLALVGRTGYVCTNKVTYDLYTCRKRYRVGSSQRAFFPIANTFLSPTDFHFLTPHTHQLTKFYEWLKTLREPRTLLSTIQHTKILFDSQVPRARVHPNPTGQTSALRQHTSPHQSNKAARQHGNSTHTNRPINDT